MLTISCHYKAFGAIFEALRTCRRDLAAEAGVPPYVIFHDATLREMAQIRPKSRHDLALVTGVGRGIGREVARQLSAAGARVLINDLDAEPLAETLALLPADCASLAGDMTDAALPLKLVDATVSQLGGLDIIVNNAGYTWDNVIQKMTDAASAGRNQSAS